MTPSVLRRAGPWLALALLGAMAFWLYQPWRGRPFDVIDFSDFLGRLAAGTGFVDRLARLVGYYGAEHGRFNALSYAGLVAKWQLFGPNPFAWQLVRAAQLLLATAGTYLLLRRLSAGPWGAVLGASLVLYSYSANQAWVRLTLGEPLGLLCVLGAGLLATEARTAAHWKLMALGSGLLMALAILAKEMLVAWAPIVVYLGCYLNEQGRLEPIKRPDARGFWVLRSVGIGTVVASVPVILAIVLIKQQGYATLFGGGGRSLLRIAEIAQRMLVPWPVAQAGEGPVLMLPAALFVLAIVLGFRRSRGVAGWESHARRATLLGLALPILGTALYAPWPVYWPPYGLPFLFGSGLVLAMAVTSAEAVSPRSAMGGRAVAALCIALVIAPSIHRARRLAARQEVNAGLAMALLEHRGADSTIVALVIPPRSALVGIGPAMRDYALAMSPGSALPPARDAQCAEVVERIRRGLGRTNLISYADQCGALPIVTVSVRRAFRYFDIERFAGVRDSMRADLFDPLVPPRQ